MNTSGSFFRRASETTPLVLAPLNSKSLREQAYARLKAAIADTDPADVDGIVGILRAENPGGGDSGCAGGGFDEAAAGERFAHD